MSPPHRVVTLADDDYPDRVRALEKPPSAISIEGSLEARFVVAIVGSRAATPGALAFAASLAGRVIDAGGVVVSGGAVGVDAAAHRGALGSGGRTWCVAPNGRRHVYPEGHADLFDTLLAAGGTMVWPFPCDEPAHRGNFFVRNSVLAALADVMVVVQAGAPSGALNAAFHARRLARPVWAVAGPPWEPSFTGCLSEIERGGAHTLTSIDSFLVAVGLSDVPPQAPTRRRARAPGSGRDAARDPEPRMPLFKEGDARRVAGGGDATLAPLDADQLALLEATSTEAKHVDEIAAIARVCAGAAATALLTLALENVVVEGPAGFYRREKSG